MKCPEGHEVEKKRHSIGKLAKECPKNCAEYKKCRFDHNVKVCYWCNTCRKHYSEKECKVRFIFR